jgi:hypothetical protein
VISRTLSFFHVTLSCFSNCFCLFDELDTRSTRSNVTVAVLLVVVLTCAESSIIVIVVLRLAVVILQLEVVGIRLC